MKKLALLTALVGLAGFINVGCSAQGSIRTTSTATTTTTAHVAYTTAPTR